MFKYVIEGSKNISGTVKISGSKNASLPLLVASILTDEPITLHNVPDLVDVHVLINILEPLGKKVDFKNNTTIIISQNGKSDEAPYKLVKKNEGLNNSFGTFACEKKTLPSFLSWRLRFWTKTDRLAFERHGNVGS